MNTENRLEFYKYSWEEWCDFMRFHHNVSIPRKIQLRTATKDGKNEWAVKPVRDATVYELTTAIIDLEREIHRLREVKDALMAIQIETRGKSRDGSMTVYDALFDSSKWESADDSEK